MPRLTNPPGTPRITGWGSYEEALQGRPVFVSRYNAESGSRHTNEGHGVTAQVQQAIIHGTQYTWDDGTQTQGTALLWRTVGDTDSIEGASGSVLCLGKPEDETARALLFQNFQGPLMSIGKEDDNRQEIYARFKGGFLLPEEIRYSQIITGDVCAA